MHGHGVWCGTPRTWEECGKVSLSATDCAGVQGCFAPVRRAQAAAPCSSNTARAGPCAHPAAAACLKPAPVPAAAGQVPGRPGSGSAAQAGAQAATPGLGLGSAPAPGDLRSARFRCSRCSRNLSAAGFAQRVSHVKKCAAAGTLLLRQPAELLALNGKRVCGPACRGMALVKLHDVCLSLLCFCPERFYMHSPVHAPPRGCMHDDL